MIDLVVRLREYEQELGCQCGAPICGEAADEIGRLRIALRGVMECSGTGTRHYHIARDALQIERSGEMACGPPPPEWYGNRLSGQGQTGNCHICGAGLLVNIPHACNIVGSKP